MTASRPPSILVVDDETDTCRNLVDIFSDLGYRAEMAFNGQAALELVQKQHFDVALLDLMMPGMDGATLYREIKQVHAGIVAIIVTAYPGHPRADAALESGAWRLLAKPVDFPPLMQTIESALGQPLVLVVDDDLDLCLSLWDVLHERGYRTCIANDVATAAVRMNDDHFSVILLDMRLPDGDGSSVFQMASQINPDAHVMVFTGYRHYLSQRLQQLLAEGEHSILSKPLDIPRLLAALPKLGDRAL
jgi:DNA-binding NtrC family response regulator